MDSVANWLSYSFTTEQTNFATFTERMIGFRKMHSALRPQTWYSAEDNNGNGMVQLQWYTPAGAAADAAYWANAANHSIAWQIDGTEFGDSASAIYVAFNGWSGEVSFTLPPAGGGKTWYRVTDTCNWAEGRDNVALPGSESWIGGAGASYSLCGRAILLLIAK